MGLGFNDFTAGDTLTAAQVDGYLMRQTTMVFASSSARDTALSGNLEEGMFAYCTDVNDVSYYDGTNWVLYSAAGTYTPTLGSMAIGTGGGATNTAKYRYSSGILNVWGDIVFGTSGATLPAGSTENIAFPSGFTSDLPGNDIPIGTVRMLVTGDDYMGPLLGGTGAVATLRVFAQFSTTWVDTNPPAPTVPATWAAGDRITYHFSVPASATD